MSNDFYHDASGQPVPLRRSTRSLAVAYRDPVPAKDLESLIRGDDRLARFIISPELERRRLVLFRRGDAAVGSIDDFAARLGQSAAVRYVSLVFYRGESPVVISDELVVKLAPGATRAQLDALNASEGVEVVRGFTYAPSSFLLRVREPVGLSGALEYANRYYQTGLFAYSEPNFIQVLEPCFRPNDPFYPQQWHLPRVNAEQAWDITRGDPAVRIAVIDTGIDIDHEDFATPGKVLAPLDVVSNDADPRPVAGDNHGTAVAGVAVADGDNGLGVSGIAPRCSLIPIRFLGAAVTNERQADTFDHATSSGAAVINNSWTPGNIPGPMPGIVSDAIDDAVNNGRGGRGCVILFAAGNDNVSISAAASFNSHAADARVLAVSAVHDGDTRSGYSNFGPPIAVCAPSNGTGTDGSTLAIFTTDPTGAAGANGPVPRPNETSPDLNYTSTFGGTSSACPLAAGVVGLMLSAAPDLTRQQVAFVLTATADKVDFANTDPTGQYLPNGHSDWYGFGRVNAFEAVKSARSSVPDRDFVQSVLVTLRRTSGDRFVSTHTIRTIDARQRRADTAAELFIRGGTDGFLRVEMTGAFDEVEVDP